MQPYEPLVLLVFCCIILSCAAVIWFAVASWYKYRFSAWWLLALLFAPFAQLLFPLYGSLRYKAAKKGRRPSAEIARNRIYRRMCWAIPAYVVVVNATTYFLLRLSYAGWENELQYGLTTLSLLIAAILCLWIFRRK
ncbi:hypothetical protein [Alistipes sp.]|uniref:hypothetical protein n=1 Tax=Alistipes sp. TaxID=1872444 RepID=UPI003AF0487F